MTCEYIGNLKYLLNFLYQCFVFSTKSYSRVFLKLRGFGRGRAPAFKRGEMVLKHARQLFRMPRCPESRQLEAGRIAMRICKFY